MSKPPSKKRKISTNFHSSKLINLLKQQQLTQQKPIPDYRYDIYINNKQQQKPITPYGSGIVNLLNKQQQQQQQQKPITPYASGIVNLLNKQQQQQQQQQRPIKPYGSGIVNLLNKQKQQQIQIYHSCSQLRIDLYIIRNT